MNSKKQQFLDREQPTNNEWITQQLLINCTKTEIGAINRSLRKLDKLLYKTWAKQTPLIDIMINSEAAELIIKDRDAED